MPLNDGDKDNKDDEIRNNGLAKIKKMYGNYT